MCCQGNRGVSQSTSAPTPQSQNLLGCLTFQVQLHPNQSCAGEAARGQHCFVFLLTVCFHCVAQTVSVLCCRRPWQPPPSVRPTETVRNHSRDTPLPRCTCTLMILAEEHCIVQQTPTALRPPAQSHHFAASHDVVRCLLEADQVAVKRKLVEPASSQHNCAIS